jgi:hypothetical protein
MAVEDQELRLKVVLDDQASAGLAQLKGNITQLTSGQAAASLDKFKRSQQEIGEGIKKLTELATGGERAMLGMIGRMGAFGVVVGGLGAVLTSTVTKMAELAEKAKLIGVQPATFKNMVDQLEKAGVDADKAQSSVAGFADALAELSRVGSERYQQAINMAGTHKADMIASLAQIEKLTTWEQKFNWAQQQSENVRQYRYEANKRRGVEENVAQADAAKAANTWLESILKLDESTRLLGPHMREMGEEEKKRYAELFERSEKANKAIKELTVTSKGLGETLVLALGPGLAEVIRNTTHEIELLNKALQAVEKYLTPEELPPGGGNAPPSFWDRFSGRGQGGGGGFTEQQRQRAGELIRGGQGTTILPNGSAVGPGTGAGAGDAPSGGAPPIGSAGGSGGITAPAGTPIARGGMASVTTASGKKFQVDARYAQNFQGFINDYEKAGGVIGPSSGTLGERPSNPSGHPIGAAIDVNQIGRNIRSGGVSLPAETERAIAAKWGMVSGADWRNPDAGHFGIRSQDAAKQALIDQGLTPDQANAAVTGKPPGQAQGQTPDQTNAGIRIRPTQSDAGRQGGQGVIDKLGADVSGAGGPPTVKGSWFGSGPGWKDPSEPVGRPTASGASNQVPGIALPSRAGLGKMFEVTTPDGRKFMLPQTDIGPAARTGRGIDITSAAATQMGYTSKTFPTDQGFSFRRADDDRAVVDSNARQGVKVEGTGKLTADINAPPGTKVNVEGDGLFKKTEVNRQTQMEPASVGPPTPTFSERFSGER